MKERPILFSGPMVRAILEGRKTMTRRVVRDLVSVEHLGARHVPMVKHCGNWYLPHERSPYGQPGDRLWVRETFSDTWELGDYPGEPFYKATYLDDWKSHDPQNWAVKWRPSIFMPRSSSRILLEVTAVRVERVQDISERDATAEGCIASNDDLTDGYFDIPARSSFETLWDSINASRGYGWDSNPWVWVVEFKAIHP